MNEWKLMTVSEHESERLSESVRLDANTCTCILSKSQNVLIWMAVSRSGLAERCTGWSIMLCWGLITRWLILNPHRTIGPSPVMLGCTTIAALTTHYKQAARSKMVHCLSMLAALLTCISPQTCSFISLTYSFLVN